MTLRDFLRLPFERTLHAKDKYYEYEIYRHKNGVFSIKKKGDIGLFNALFLHIDAEKVFDGREFMRPILTSTISMGGLHIRGIHAYLTVKELELMADSSFVKTFSRPEHSISEHSKEGNEA